MSDFKIVPKRADGLTSFHTEYLHNLLMSLSPDNIVEGGKVEMTRRLKKTFRAENKLNLFLVAYNSKRKLVGTGAFYSIPFGPRWEFWIKDIVVHEEYRRKGLATEIGEKLLVHAKTVAAHFGRTILVRARCEPSQTAAKKFFRRFGFKEKSVPAKDRNNKLKPHAEIELYIEVEPG